MSFSLYYHTLKFLKGEQLLFQVYYKVCAKVRRLLSRKDDYTCYKKGNPLAFNALPEKYTAYHGDGMFCFLNLSHHFDGAWDDRSQGDLWRYNLNYMDFLLQPEMDVQEGLAWIERFIGSIENNAIAADPYPISLRGINWIKFVSLHREELTPSQLAMIDTSLYSQYRVLERRTERHLLANHYLENGFSLLFAAVYFRDAAFWKKARQIVTAQLEEQILPDGAHYELSPMYHCVILERLLDCCNLLSVVDSSMFDGMEPLRNLLHDKAVAMLSWMEAIVWSDDTLPLLNDAADGVALPPAVLREYAKQLHVEWGKGTLGKSGYRHATQPFYEAIIDMAPLGVSYNLGHAHADTSTFLLRVNGGPLIVDTGTSTYNAGCRRSYERSTRAHNAVVIDGEDSSKVWGAFRCAQRAQVVIENDGPDEYAMKHDGYRDKQILCRRRFLCRENAFEVIDSVEGMVSCEAIAYFHLAPDLQILSVDSCRVVTDRAVLTFEGQQSLQLEQMEVAREYNSLQESQCVRVVFAGMLRTIIDGFK